MVISFVILIIYWFILSAVDLGFPVNLPVNYPYNYLLWFTVGLIAFEWSIYSFTIIGAKNKIMPLTRWGITWIAAMTIGYASFSVCFFNYLVTQKIGIALYFSIPTLIGSLVAYFSGRTLENKNRQTSDMKQ